jgi:hypothetical protein
VYFELRDGKPVWAIAKATIQTEEGIETIYLFDESELAQYPDAERLEQPSEEILTRAAQIEGKILSKSEFTRLLYEKTKEEQQQETINALGQELAAEKIKNMEMEAIIQSLGQEMAALKLELMQLKGGE